MKILSCAVLTVLVLAGISPFQAQTQEFIVAPRENTLVTIASQLDCPLKIEDPHLLLNTRSSADFRFQYQLRNVGPRTIKSFRIAFITSEASGGTLTDERLRNGTLVPGDVIPIDKFRGNIIPVTDDLMKQLKLGVPMKMVVILIVEKVTFTDGTTYTDERTSEALRKYFQDLIAARD